MSGDAPSGYTEVRQLGAGASGRVVLAVHEGTGTRVAVKCLDGALFADDAFLRNFRAEARILAELDDPWIVRLYEYVETASGAAVVMELVNGVSLRPILRERGPLEPQAALAVLKGSLLGLGAAHARGVVHRDYKPENVLVDAAGASKIADFGIAVRAEREADVAGTPSYMSPEQWAGAPASPRTDIYAATATFFECLTGRPPFTSPDLAMLRRQHEQAPIPASDIPEPLRALVRSGLAKEASDRPADAAALVDELERVAVRAYGAGWEESGRRKLARRAALLALLWPLPPTAFAASSALTRLGRGLIGSAVVTLVVVGSGLAGSTLGPTGSGSPAPPPPSVVTTADPPAPTATASEAPPSATPTASTAPAPPPGQLSASIDAGPAYCLNGTYPTITIKNTGGVAISWSANATEGVLVSPSSGTLAPGASQTLTVTGGHPPPVSVVISGTGGTKTLSFDCL